METSDGHPVPALLRGREFLKNDKDVERLQINAQNCIHCKTCDIKEPTQNIAWTVHRAVRVRAMTRCNSREMANEAELMPRGQHGDSPREATQVESRIIGFRSSPLPHEVSP